MSSLANSVALTFNLLAQDNASRVLRNVGDEAERTGSRAGAGLSAIGTAAAAAGSLLAGAGIVEAFRGMVDAADESRRIAARTENVIRTTGQAAGVTADQVGDLAAAIAAKTGVDDEAIQAGENLLLTFTNIQNVAGEGNDIFDQATQIMVDMSAAMGTDASGSAIQLGKALNDPIKGMSALTRVGVSFTQAQKDQVEAMVAAGDTLGAQKIILEELQKEFGGAAEAMGTPMDRLKVAAGNLQEELGGYLLPVVDSVADSLANGLGGASEELGPKLAGAAQAFADMIPDLVDLAETGLDLATNVLPLLGGGLGLLLDVANQLGPALPGIATGIAAMKVAQGVGGGVQSLAGALGQTEGKLGGVGRGLSAVSVALPIIGGVVTQVTDSLNKQDEQIQENVQRFGGYLSQIREGGAAASQAMIDYSHTFLGQIGIAIEDAPGWDQAIQAARDYWDSLSPLAQAQSKVNEWTNTLSYSLETYGANSEEVRTAQERLAYWTQIQTDRQGALDGAIAEATGTTGTYTAGLQEAVDAAKDAQDQTNLLKSALDALTGANVSVDQATASYYSALRDAQAGLGDVTGAVVAYNGYLDLSTEAGSAAADQLIDLAEQSHGYMAALQTQGATQEEVAALDSQLRDAFYQTALQMSGNEESARLLTERYYGIPEDIATIVTADTSQAESQINALLVNYRGRQITVGAGFSGTLGTLAFGGPVPGWSPHKRADNIPIMATAGEYMQNVDAVDYYGVGFMEALNRRQIPRDQLQYLANGGLVDGIQLRVAADTGNLARQLAAATSGSTPGGGSVGGGWTSIWNWIKARVPQARVNSTFRAGDPGYHGRGKAVDLGFGSGPGGNGSAGLALINRTLFDGLGGNLAELIYDGIGDDRADIKNGRPHTYNAGTRAEHHNHVHAAVYGDGTNYVPQDGYAYLHQGETVIPAASQGAPFSGLEITGTLAIGGDGLARIVDGRIVTALTGATQRRRYNP